MPLTQTSKVLLELTEEDIEYCTSLIKKWQRKLNLNHWRIEISRTPPRQPGLLEVITNRLRNHAAIRISPAAFETNWERLIVHELVHLIIDPIREEHTLQMEALQTEREKEYSKRLLNEVERAVEHLSYVLYSA